MCISTMHHLEHCQSCITIRFCFGTGLHCTSCTFGMIPWFSVGRTNSTYTISPVLIMSLSVVIVNMNSWCGFFIPTGQEELLHLSIHDQTLQESNMGRIMNHDISIQSTIVQELFVEEYNWFVVWREWLGISPPAKPPSKDLFTWRWGTPGRCCISLRWGQWPDFPFNLSF